MMQQITQMPRIIPSNCKPIPTLESTTPATRNPGVTVELETGVVSGGGREENQTATLGWSTRYGDSIWN